MLNPSARNDVLCPELQHMVRIQSAFEIGVHIRHLVDQYLPMVADPSPFCEPRQLALLRRAAAKLRWTRLKA